MIQFHTTLAFVVGFRRNPKSMVVDALCETVSEVVALDLVKFGGNVGFGFTVDVEIGLLVVYFNFQRTEHIAIEEIVNAVLKRYFESLCGDRSTFKYSALGL